MIELNTTIRVELTRAGVARLTLARPDKHNALNATMLAEIAAAAERLGADQDVRVVVLASEGSSFCAGGDLEWMREQAGRHRTARIGQAKLLTRMLETLDRMPKLTIAEIGGPALGGGVGLVSVCDIAVAAAEAVFALSEARLGLIPATIGPFVVDRIGAANARAVMLNAKRFDAAAALRMGLISAVVPSASLREAVDREVAFGLRCAPGAVADAKALIRRLASREILGADATASLLADRWDTAEAEAGLSAFFTRSRPPWSPVEESA